MNKGFIVNATFKNGKTVTYIYRMDFKNETALQRLTRHMHTNAKIIKYTVEPE